jgi:hypothetical protein
MTPREVLEAAEVEADLIASELVRIRIASLTGQLPDFIRDRAEEARNAYKEFLGEDEGEVARGTDSGGGD